MRFLACLSRHGQYKIVDKLSNLGVLWNMLWNILLIVAEFWEWKEHMIEIIKEIVVNYSETSANYQE